MPLDLTPRMLRGFRLHSTTTLRSCGGGGGGWVGGWVLGGEGGGWGWGRRYTLSHWPLR